MSQSTLVLIVDRICELVSVYTEVDAARIRNSTTKGTCYTKPEREARMIARYFCYEIYEQGLIYLAQVHDIVGGHASLCDSFFYIKQRMPHDERLQRIVYAITPEFENLLRSSK